MIATELLKILACPVCKAPLREISGELHCQKPTCGLIYPIREQIPILLQEEARKPR